MEQIEKLFHIRLYFILEEGIEPTLLYGMISPKEDEIIYLNKLSSYNIEKKFTRPKIRIDRLDFYTTENLCGKFFKQIQDKSISDFEEFDFTEVKKKELLKWKLNGNIVLFKNVFLESDSSSNSLREHRSWQNINMGSSLADIYLQLDKDYFFSKGKEFFINLNNFFKKETGIKLIEIESDEMFPYGEEWKRLGNLEFIKRSEKKKNQDLFEIKFSSYSINFLIKPELSNKKYISVSYMLSNFGLIHSSGMKSCKINKEIITEIDFTIETNLACKFSYQIYESNDGISYNLIAEHNVLYIKAFQFSLRIMTDLPELHSSDSYWNRFITNLSQKEEKKKNLLKIEKYNFNEVQTVRPEKKDFFYDLQKYEKLIQESRNKKSNSYSKFFNGNDKDKYEFALFLKNVCDSFKKKGVKINKIILADPFANAETIQSFIVHQDSHVELILNSSQKRERTESDPEGDSDQPLINKIIQACLEYSGKIPTDTKIIDINKISNPKERSFHDRYILIETSYSGKIFYNGFLLSSSLSSYFAGTPASISELDVNTSTEIFNYLEALKSGYSNLEKMKNNKKDLVVSEIWPGIYAQKKIIAQNEKTNLKKEILDFGIKLLKQNNINFPIELEESEYKEIIEYKPKFQNNLKIDLTNLVPYFQNKPTEESIQFFAFLNILSVHTYSENEEFFQSLYDSFLSNQLVKEKYIQYVNEWENYNSPIGIKNEFISYEQLPILQKLFFVFKDSPHIWLKSISDREQTPCYHNDLLTELYELYLQFDPEFAIKLLENLFDESNFFEKLNLISNETELRKLQKTSRLGQALKANFLYYIRAIRIPKFFITLTGSKNTWIKQLGLIGVYNLKTGLLDNFSEEFKSLIENEEFLSNKISETDKISFIYTIYSHWIKLKLELIHKKLKNEKFYLESKTEFFNYFKNLDDNEIFEKMKIFLFIYQNDLDVIVEIIQEAKEFFSAEVIQKLYEEILIRFIALKLKEKNKELEIHFNGYFSFKRIKLNEVFNLLKDKDSLKKRAWEILEKFKKNTLIKFNDPFIRRKNLNRIWKLTEGLAWCVFFILVLDFDKNEIDEFDKLVMFYFEKRERVYYDWPDFNSLIGASDIEAT